MKVMAGEQVNIIGIGDIEAAAKRLKGVAVQTPILENPLLNQAVGGACLHQA